MLLLLHDRSHGLPDMIWYMGLSQRSKENVAVKEWLSHVHYTIWFKQIYFHLGLYNQKS